MSSFDLAIIIPCYNQGIYLDECLKSIVSNITTRKYEICIINDCSTDNTHEIIVSLSTKYKFKYIINRINQKLPETRNIGIRNTESKYIICLDADDMIPKNYIESNYINLITNDVDVSYCNSNCFGHHNNVYNWPEHNINNLRIGPYINCSAMYKRMVWEKTNYDKQMVYGWEDYDFWLAAAINGFNFKKNNNSCLYYRQKQNSMINDTNTKLETIIKPILRVKYSGFYLG